MQTVLSCNTHAKRCCKELNLKRKQSSKVFLFSTVWTTLVKRMVAHLASCILLTVSGSFGWTWSSLGYFKSSLWQCRGLFNAAEKYASWKAIIILVNCIYGQKATNIQNWVFWSFSQVWRSTSMQMFVLHDALHYAEIKGRRGLPLIVVQSDWKGKSLGWDKTFTADVAW